MSRLPIQHQVFFQRTMSAEKYSIFQSMTFFSQCFVQIPHQIKKPVCFHHVRHLLIFRPCLERHFCSLSSLLVSRVTVNRVLSWLLTSHVWSCSVLLPSERDLIPYFGEGIRSERPRNLWRLCRTLLETLRRSAVFTSANETSGCVPACKPEQTFHQEYDPAGAPYHKEREALPPARCIE